MRVMRSMSDLGLSIDHQGRFWIHESALRRWIDNPNEFVEGGASSCMEHLKAFFLFVRIAHHSRSVAGTGTGIPCSRTY
jgi:hypothetical protein